MLGVILSIALLSTPQREKPVIGVISRDRVDRAENAAAQVPRDPWRARELAQAYVAAGQPGMALAALERGGWPMRGAANYTSPMSIEGVENDH